MPIHFDELTKDLQKKAREHAKKTGESAPKRVRIGADSIKRHALAVDALLLDDRGLTTQEARRILQKAIKLLK